MSPLEADHRSHLRMLMGGYFYRTTEFLSKEAAFRALRNIARSRNLSVVTDTLIFEGNHRSRDRVATCIYRYERTPTFAPNCEALKERRYGFCALLETRRVLFVAHTGFSWSTDLLAIEDLQVLAPQDYRAVVGSLKNVRVGRVGTRAMSVGSKAIYSRTTEGDDLESSLPSLGAGRHVLTTMQARSETGQAIRFSTGTTRLSETGPRLSLDNLRTWVRKEMVARLESTEAFPFLDRFAQPIRLDQLPLAVEPSGFSLAGALSDADGLAWSLRRRKGDLRSLSAAVVRGLLNRLLIRMAEPKKVSVLNGDLYSTFPKPIGRVRIRQNRRSFSIENPFLQRLCFIDPKTQRPRSVVSLLNEERRFMVTFSDIEYAYVDGQMVRSAHVRQSLHTVVRAIEEHRELANVTSEKGKSRQGLDPRSLFAAIENACAKNDEFLVLEDGNQEWADYIGISTSGLRPVLSFYHAKFTGKMSHSASVLQEVIGQAEKNVGRILSSERDLVDRASSMWKKDCKLPTGIRLSRLRRSPPNGDLDAALREVSTNPNTLRRACIVVSSLSRARLSALADSGGNELKPHEAQLAWLLSTFVSACADSNVVPAIMCPP